MWEWSTLKDPHPRQHFWWLCSCLLFSFRCNKKTDQILPRKFSPNSWISRWMMYLPHFMPLIWNFHFKLYKPNFESELQTCQTDCNGNKEICNFQPFIYFNLSLYWIVQYLKKLHTQERAVEEVKLAIKPYYQRKDINKDEYKDILRKAVHKVSLSTYNM